MTGKPVSCSPTRDDPSPPLWPLPTIVVIKDWAQKGGARSEPPQSQHLLSAVGPASRLGFGMPQDYCMSPPGPLPAPRLPALVSSATAWI